METERLLRGAVPAATATAAPTARPAGSLRLRSYLELTKPRITALVMVTAAAGFYLGGAGQFDLLLFLHAMLGTAIVAAGTSAMNQVLERDVDALMKRTRNRPLPAGRLTTVDAALFAGSLAAVGILYLTLAVNALTGALALTTFLSYDFLYTPLKRVHSFSTVIGAVPGALPIVGGWAAAAGTIGPEAGVLFGVLFLWQLPHFLALAWILRDDYDAAGLRMLSVGDTDAFQTRHQTLIYTLVLLPVTLLPTMIGLAGTFYFGAALVLGLGFVWASLRFWRDATPDVARKLFRYSILYLPVLLLLLVADRVRG